MVSLHGSMYVSFLFKFDAIHTRGSSHGGSRMVANTYREKFNVDLVEEACKIWRDVEDESGKHLYMLVIDIIVV